MVMVSYEYSPPQRPQVTSDMKTKNQPKDMFLNVRFQGLPGPLKTHLFLRTHIKKT